MKALIKAPASVRKQLRRSARRQLGNNYTALALMEREIATETEVLEALEKSSPGSFALVVARKRFLNYVRLYRQTARRLGLVPAKVSLIKWRR